MVEATGGLVVVDARRGPGAITTDIPTRELAGLVGEGRIVVVKGAFEPAGLRRMRSAILAWNAPSRENDTSAAGSTRQRSEDPPGTPIRHVFESFLFDVNDAADPIGPTVRPAFDRLAEFWRALTGHAFGFAPDAEGRALRPRALYYPAGGGYFDWHEHPLEPHRIGAILGVSELGVDFGTGATEFKAPNGLVSTEGAHDLGDVCLFRYDLAHRVTAVDANAPRRWDGPGRWTFIIPLQ
ncbi:hypothetical protein BWI17_01535 [Betaproteobacteria bacterium GR16-43]|nr:hypothetical protein BWI17_01535 [Betaproteobacteria bacterium GR16-43]